MGIEKVEYESQFGKQTNRPLKKHQSFFPLSVPKCIKLDMPFWHLNLIVLCGRWIMFTVHLFSLNVSFYLQLHFCTPALASTPNSSFFPCLFLPLPCPSHPFPAFSSSSCRKIGGLSSSPFFLVVTVANYGGIIMAKLTFWVIHLSIPDNAMCFQNPSFQRIWEERVNRFGSISDLFLRKTVPILPTWVLKEGKARAYWIMVDFSQFRIYSKISDRLHIYGIDFLDG